LLYLSIAKFGVGYLAFKRLPHSLQKPVLGSALLVQLIARQLPEYIVLVFIFIV